jgi:hypothetical protein
MWLVPSPNLFLQQHGDYPINPEIDTATEVKTHSPAVNLIARADNSVSKDAIKQTPAWVDGVTQGAIEGQGD